jgi:hypothetical protein
MAQILFACGLIMYFSACLVAAFFLPTFEYGSTGPATFPKAISSMSILISAGFLLNSLKHRNTGESLLPDLQQAGVLLLFLAYVVIMPIIGFMPSSFVFMVVLSLYLSEPGKRLKSLPVSLISTTVVLAIIYCIFAVQLNVFLP